MKKEFTKDEMIAGRGCYLLERLMTLPFMSKEIITIEDVLTSEISIKDKRWMVYNNCQLNLIEKKQLALQLAWCVLPIYEEKYPNDNRVRDCLQATEDFYKGIISVEKLGVKRNAAYAAAYADADDAAYAANAAANAAYAAYAANAAANATYAAAAAANAAANKLTYTQKIQEILINFVK